MIPSGAVPFQFVATITNSTDPVALTDTLTGVALAATANRQYCVTSLLVTNAHDSEVVFSLLSVTAAAAATTIVSANLGADGGGFSHHALPGYFTAVGSGLQAAVGAAVAGAVRIVGSGYYYP